MKHGLKDRLDDEKQQIFDRLLFENDDSITVATAERLAKELGLWFRPDYYDVDNIEALQYLIPFGEEG